ncbi:MAG TPA: hypothetical protein VN889_06150 [Solirubrobacteraceae bacterium]|nr:hypothetical protein [Solirubrobacteraceae bacterium]
MAGRIFNVALATSLALAALAASAHAGTYHVYSCRTPDGEVAPVDGWSGSVAAGGAFDDYALDTCGEGGALVAALGDQTIHASQIDQATWMFSAPTSEQLVGATLWRAGYLHGQAGENTTYQFWLAGPTENLPFDECIFTLGCPLQGSLGQPLSPENRILVPPASLGSRLYVTVNCGVVESRYCQPNAGDANGYAAALYLYAADLTLEQAEGPHASNVAGELASAPTLQGSSDVTFDASDPGSGVYEALFSIDGQVVQRTVLDANGGRCRDVGQTTDGTPAFLYVQPCVGSLSADVSFDTTAVANGTHHLLVSVIDAAGNAAPVLDRTVTIDNPPAPGAPGPPNGANASAQASLAVRWQGTRKAQLVSGYGSSHVVSGRLTAPGGAPITGAAVELSATPSVAGARTISMPSARTDATGRFSVRLSGGGSSRTLRFAYRARVGEPRPAATRTLRLSVHASIALNVSPHLASVGSTIAFRGRLRGGSVPATGKQLVLEARSPGSPWIEFKVVHTDARGRFHASYRFKFAGPADYSFRARSEPEADYPFAAGASNVVAVHER